MSSGHVDLLDGIYGNRGEGLRTQETVAFGEYREGEFTGANSKGIRSRGKENTLFEVRAKSTVGEWTPALLTSSS